MTARPLAVAIAAAALACASVQARPVQSQAQPGTAPAAAAVAGQRERVVDATFKAWDADHDGMLSQDEFRQGWSSVRRRAEDKVEASLRAQFDKVDANHDGAIDGTEYGHLMLVQRAGKSAPALATFDRNADGRLGFEEYLAMVAKLAVAPEAPKGKSP